MGTCPVQSFPTPRYSTACQVLSRLVGVTVTVIICRAARPDNPSFRASLNHKGRRMPRPDRRRCGLLELPYFRPINQEMNNCFLIFKFSVLQGRQCFFRVLAAEVGSQPAGKHPKALYSWQRAQTLTRVAPYSSLVSTLDCTAAPLRA